MRGAQALDMLLDRQTGSWTFPLVYRAFQHEPFAAAADLGIRAGALARDWVASLSSCGRSTPMAAGRTAVSWRSGGRGRPLLLLNGWTASGLVWPAEWVAHLERRFRVIRPDNRGTGSSGDMSAPFTIADLADDAHRVLEAHCADRAIVLGLSMGGMIAQELALRHPDSVSHLVLVGTRPPTPAHVPAEFATLAGALRPPEKGRSLEEHYRVKWSQACAPGFPERNPHLMQEIVGQILRRPTPRSVVYAQACAVAAWRGPRRLGSLDVPTVVVHGDQDPLMPVGNGVRLARLIPGAEYVELPGVGHLVPHEAGPILAGIVERCDDRTERTSCAPH